MKNSLVRPCLAAAVLIYLSAQAHAAPQPVSPAALSSARPGLGAKLATLMSKVRLPPKVQQAIDSRLCATAARCTQLADRVQASLPTTLVPTFEKARLLSPLTLSSYAVKKFREDPVFLTGAGIGTMAAGYVALPAMVGLGVNPAAAFVIKQVVETPIEVGLIAWRQHELRSDRSQTLLGTLRGLGREYRAFATERREQNRRLATQLEAGASSAATAP